MTDGKIIILSISDSIFVTIIIIIQTFDTNISAYLYKDYDNFNFTNFC